MDGPHRTTAQVARSAHSARCSQIGQHGKAAADLAISQPSVSKAIAEVEHAIGLRLLDRGPQGIEPTIYGRALLKCGVAVFDELRQGVKEVEFLTDPNAGEVRIGCTETMAAGFVSAIIDRLSRQYPRVTFHLIPADSITLLNRELRQRNVELVITATSSLSLERDLNVEILFDDKIVVMAGAESKWIRRRKLNSLISSTSTGCYHLPIAYLEPTSPGYFVPMASSLREYTWSHFHCRCTTICWRPVDL